MSQPAGQVSTAVSASSAASEGGDRALRAAGALAQLSSATVHEAQGTVGALPAAIRLRSDPNTLLCAPVMTVACQPGENLTIHRALYATPPGWALIVTTGGAPEYGYFGEVMATAAQAVGIVGVIIDGGVRDTAQLTALQFPVFSAEVAIRGTAKYGGGTVGEPLVIGGVPVTPGDIAIGDRDGVVIVGQDTASSVAAAARARDEKEAGFLDELRGGATTLDLFGWSE